MKNLQLRSTIGTLIGTLAALPACTGQIPNSFRIQPVKEEFNIQVDVNTKIDLLWVVDNSSSMDVSQEKLRNGFTTFAQKYLKPTWDIRVAVITTDTYLADPAFGSYLGSTMSGTVGYSSPYINSRLATWTNPSWNPTLLNLRTGAFDSGVKFSDSVPVWGPSYGKLLPGLHDGPIPGLCFEGLPYFLNGVTQCAIRDDQTRYSGVAGCLSPASGETALTQCVNTVQNNTVHSGKPILSTLPPAGVPASYALTQELIEQFMVNVTTGSVGHGSERGFGSVIQLLKDNERSASAFFRPDAVRGIIFVSDEDDQTLSIEASLPSAFTPWTHYQCDQASLLAMNGTAGVIGNRGACCTDSSLNCRFGSEGTTCPAKTVDGYTYTLSFCPRADYLLPAASVKQQLDGFFKALDGTEKPNYFVTSVVALTGTAIQSLQASRDHDDTMVGGMRTIAVDRGDRYIELGNLVGNGSMAMNIADSDYSPILDAIGRAMVENRSSFTVKRAPTGTEDMILSILHANGSKEIIPREKYIVIGNIVTITDYLLVLTFSSTDKMLIDYQPKTVL